MKKLTLSETIDLINCLDVLEKKLGMKTKNSLSWLFGFEDGKIKKSVGKSLAEYDKFCRSDLVERGKMLDIKITKHKR